MNRRDFLHVLGAIGVVSIPFEALAGIQADVDVASPGTIMSDGFPHDKRATDLERNTVLIHDKPHYQECDFSSVTLPVQNLSARSVY